MTTIIYTLCRSENEFVNLSGGGRNQSKTQSFRLWAYPVSGVICSREDSGKREKENEGKCESKEDAERNSSAVFSSRFERTCLSLRTSACNLIQTCIACVFNLTLIHSSSLGAPTRCFTLFYVGNWHSNIFIMTPWLGLCIGYWPFQGYCPPHHPIPYKLKLGYRILMTIQTFCNYS